jgi:hypothetical protein
MRTLAGCVAEHTGRDVTLAPIADDPGARALLVLLAKYELPRLLDVLPRTVKTEFWLKMAARPLSHLKPDVVDYALAEDAELARVEASRKQRQQRSAAPRKVEPTLARMSAADTLASIQVAREALGG